MAGNVSIEMDAAVNWKPSKKKSVERIDGIVAPIMGWTGRRRSRRSSGRFMIGRAGVFGVVRGKPRGGAFHPASPAPAGPTGRRSAPTIAEPYPAPPLELPDPLRDGIN